MATIDDQVEASSDDANQITSGAMFLTDTIHVMGFAGIGVHSGQRFDTLISGLSGVTITDAYLTWMAESSDSGSFVSIMYAEDGATPSTFTTTSNNITDRTQTTASVTAGSTQLGNWTSGQEYTLTITSLIQEIADSYDPNAIVLMSIYSSGSGKRFADTFDADETIAPKLHITYTAGIATRRIFITSS